MITEQIMKKYKDIVTGITIDRGCGDESFPVLKVKEEDNTIYYYLGNNDWIDKDFLNSCSYVKFHVTYRTDTTVKVKDDLPVMVTKQTLSNLYDLFHIICERLWEVKDVPTKLDYNTYLLIERIKDMRLELAELELYRK